MALPSHVVHNLDWEILRIVHIALHFEIYPAEGKEVGAATALLVYVPPNLVEDFSPQGRSLCPQLFRGFAAGVRL